MSESTAICIFSSAHATALKRSNINYTRHSSLPLPIETSKDRTVCQNKLLYDRRSSLPDSTLDFTDGLAILPLPRNPSKVIPFNSRRSSSKVPETMELHLGGERNYRYGCTGPVVDGEWTADALIAGEVSEEEFQHQRFYRYVAASPSLPTPDGGQACLIEIAVEGKFIGIRKSTANNTLFTDVAIFGDDHVVNAAERTTELVWVMKKAAFEGDILWTFSPYGQSDVFLCLATPSSTESRLTVATDDGKIGKHFKFY